MSSKAFRLDLARITLALMLFAQGVMAWSACDWLDQSPVRAVVASAEVAPCHQSGFGGACLTHCLSDRQAVQKVTNEIPALPASPVLVVASMDDKVVHPAVEPAIDSRRSTGPPRRILLQSFQI